MQRRNLVVEGVSALVEAAQIGGQGILEQGGVDPGKTRRGGGGLDLFQDIEQAPGIAVGIADQAVAGIVVEGEFGQGAIPRPLEKLPQFLGGEAFQDIYRGAREQGGVHFEGGIFRGGADEGEQALLDVGQEGILLGLVEAMHLVDEEQGTAARPSQRQLRLGHRLADVLDPRENGGQGDELGVEGVGHQPRQRGLAHPRRPPEDHRMRLARLEGQTQRLAGTEQVGLPDHLIQRPGPQQFRQRRMGRGLQRRQQVTHRRHPPPWAARNGTNRMRSAGCARSG